MTTLTARQRFLDAARQKNILGAYLVICPWQSAAQRLIDTFMQNLYCKNGGCGTCTACRSVTQGHVDILRLHAPKVDEIRDAIAFVAQKPFAGSYRSVVIGGADDMTIPAANSLLKTLEEPPHHTVIVLLARSVSGVLPTIASRCAAVHLSPDKNAAHTIAAALGVDAQRAYILADLSGGFPDEAQLLQDDDAFWAVRDGALHTCLRLLEQKNMAVSAHADMLETNKDRLLPVLCVMQSFFRDVLVFKKTHNAALIVNADAADSVHNAALHFTSGAISNIIRVILEAERRFSVPVNFRLAAEKLFFDILEEKNRWKKS